MGKQGGSLSTDISCLLWRDLVKSRINERRLGQGYWVGKVGKLDCLDRFGPDLTDCLWGPSIVGSPSFPVGKKVIPTSNAAVGKAVSDLMGSLQQYFKKGATVISQKRNGSMEKGRSFHRVISSRNR